MKNFIYFILVISLTGVLYSFGFFEEDPNEKSNNPHNTSFYFTIDSKQMNGNNISTWYRNNGSFNRDPITGNSGFEWPKDSLKFARYASGLWIGAKVGDDTLICLAEYDYEYLPGYVDDYGNPQGAGDPSYRIYVLNAGDTMSADYRGWPANKGAYVSTNGKPYILGNQTMFFSYTDGYPEAHGNRSGSTAPLKAQILQTNWCFANSFGYFNDVIFTEYRIINRNNLPWIKCYFGQWSDDDLGAGFDDAVGCDTLLNLCFTYNFDNNDNSYGLNPPAVGFLYLRGGMIESSGDTAKYYSPPGSKNLIAKQGFKFTGASAFNSFISGNPTIGEPSNYRETYLVLQGIRRDGSQWINPITNQPTTFSYPGDPETGNGWINNFGDEVRSIYITGPVTVNPGDTHSIVIAQLISKGSNHKNSVTKLKNAAKVVKNAFDLNFDLSIDSPNPAVSSYAPGTGKIYLSWNDSCEKFSMLNKLSGGIYKFQGYNIYRIKPNNVNPGNADTILIKTFDVIDGIKDIRDSIYLNEYEGITYGIVQRGSDNGISRYIVLDKDTVSGIEFTNGSEYKFTVTAYYYDPTGGIYTLPKVYESHKHSNIIKVIPQNLTPGVQVSYDYGDTIRTDQKDLAVMPVIIEPMQLINATYSSTIGMHDSALSWTLSKSVNGMTSTIFQNEKNFSGQDTAKVYDGMMLVHQIISDSGIVRDPNPAKDYYGNIKYQSYQSGWEYVPPENLWFEGPDTQAVKTAKVITNRQFDSRSIGMSFPTNGNFRNSKSTILANGKCFQHVSATSPILKGGPLRKIQVVFGQSSMSYRYVPLDTMYSSATYADMTSVPFSVFAVDELDSSNGIPRQLNTGYMDTDNDGQWDPDTSKLGNYQFTYIFASDYNPTPNINYTSKNPGLLSPAIGFPSMDIMYAWLPRVKKKSDGTPMTYMPGDKLTVWPYRITRAEFVPGYHIKYNWTVTGTQSGNISLASAEINKIKAFPNPYYGMSELEYDSGGEKFIYFSHLPAVCDIYIYSLNGSLVRKIQRNTGDPENSLEKWDLMNSGNQRVASGMYIVYVDCKGVGAKVLKIAVFTSK